MPKTRYRSPFWRRGEPQACYDIALLRPAHLPKGLRFETIEDAEAESIRSEKLLKSAGGSSKRLARILAACGGEARCGRSFCPICARSFRRWFVGELLRVTAETEEPVAIHTILLATAGRGNIDDLDPSQFQHILRKRLIRVGLATIPAIGGFEMVYRAKQKAWVLHLNLVMLGGKARALEKFAQGFRGSEIERAIVSVPLRHPPKQLSYLLKFGTYHRPFEQRGPVKGPAKPLNAAEHLGLVRWMSQREFKHFLFLFNARRGHDAIVIRPRV